MLHIRDVFEVPPEGWYCPVDATKRFASMESAGGTAALAFSRESDDFFASFSIEGEKQGKPYIHCAFSCRRPEKPTDEECEVVLRDFFGAGMKLANSREEAQNGAIFEITTKYQFNPKVRHFGRLIKVAT